MRVHYIQHVPFEGLGFIEPWLKEKGYSISVTRFYESDYKLPAFDEIEALIIMGGPMGAFDDQIYPWLKDEKAFIKTCIEQRKKVIGICLGAQLIAACLGADVHAAPNKEIGWFPVIPTEECKKHTWFYDLFKNHPTVFHWHGDQFEIPKNGGVNLLSSKANLNQAFMYNDTVIALQFHLEVEKTNVLQMLENCHDDLEQAVYVQSIEEIAEGTIHSVNAIEIMQKLLDNFLKSDLN